MHLLLFLYLLVLMIILLIIVLDPILEHIHLDLLLLFLMLRFLYSVLLLHRYSLLYYCDLLLCNSPSVSLNPLSISYLQNHQRHSHFCYILIFQMYHILFHMVSLFPLLISILIYLIGIFTLFLLLMEFNRIIKTLHCLESILFRME